MGAFIGWTLRSVQPHFFSGGMASSALCEYILEVECRVCFLASLTSQQASS